MHLRFPLSLVAIGYLSSSLFAAPDNISAKPNVVADATTLKQSADTAYRGGLWASALSQYLRAYLAGDRSDTVKDRIGECQRLAAQQLRQRDPAFQQFVVGLPVAEALNLYAEAAEKLGANYFDKDRVTPAQLFAHGIEEFDRALSDKAFRREQFAGATDSQVRSFRKFVRELGETRLPKSVRELRTSATEMIRAAQSELGFLNPSAIVLELLCGACSGLDQYTLYVTPSIAQSALATVASELAGYGITIAVRDGAAIVERVTADSWAATNTTLRVGDRITRMNGRNLTSATPTMLLESLRFPIDGHHEIETATTVESLPIRLPTPLPTVVGIDMVAGKDGIGYLRVSSFQEHTVGELDRAIQRLKSRGLRALILDLRGNTGGTFTAGIQMSQRFVPAGILATTQGQSPEFANRVFSSDSGMSAYDFPVVMLVDSKTMSSGEIVASAMKDHRRATLIGMPTFGKGAIQCPIRLHAADGTHERSGTVILTIANVYSPRGVPLHGNGVTPDILEADPQRQLLIAIERAVAIANEMMR